MKGGLSKEVVSDKGEVSMGHIYSYMTSKAGLAKEVVFHEGGLSKGTRYYCISKFYMSSILPFQLSGPVLTSSFPQVTIAAIWSSTYKLIPSSYHCSYLVQYLQAHSLKLPLQLSGPVLTSSFPQMYYMLTLHVKLSRIS